MSHPLADFYRGKRVLVTGHTGFQGGWTVAWLKLLGAQVCGYGLPPASRPNFFDATLLDRGMTSIFADLRDRNSLTNTFAELQPEIVIHCATRANAQLSEREPIETFSANVMGTVHILEEARLTPSVRALVLISRVPADYVLSLSPGTAPLSPGDASLIAAELATSAFSKSFFQRRRTAVATARVAECDGGGDWRDGRLIPKLVHSLISEQEVHFSGEHDLKFWHVLEPVHASLLLAQQLFESGQQFSDVWEFGPNHDAVLPAAELAEKFVKRWEAEAITMPPGQNGKASNHALETQVGWSNTLNLDQAIAWTAEWYRAYHAQPSSVWRTTDDQITRFMEMRRGSESYSMSEQPNTTSAKLGR